MLPPAAAIASATRWTMPGPVGAVDADHVRLRRRLRRLRRHLAYGDQQLEFTAHRLQLGAHRHRRWPGTSTTSVIANWPLS